MGIDLEQFHQIFFEESDEGLDTMETGLMNLDMGEADPDLINEIFRAAHSIKGGSGTFGFTAISGFTHVMETLLDEMRDGKRMVTQEAVDTLLKSVDVLRAMLDAARTGADADEAAVAEAQGELEALLSGEAGGGQAEDGGTGAGGDRPQSSTAAPVSGWKIHFVPRPHLMQTGNDPLRLIRELAGLGDLDVTGLHGEFPPFAEMDPTQSYIGWDLTLASEVGREQIEEIFDWVDGDCELRIEPLSAGGAGAPGGEPAKPAAPAPASPPPAKPAGKATGGGPAQKDSGSIRVGIDKLDTLINLVGELVITQSMLGQFGEAFDVNDIEKLREGLAHLERNTRDLQESVMQVRMLPISTSFNRFPRLVRDLSKKLGKQIELKMTGENTELDKTVLEKIGDPLVHLVRNSLDHGLETPEVRAASGKPETGLLHLHACHEGGNIVIQVIDDGAGLPRDKILAKAIERGLVDEDQELTDEQIYNLIFQPGFSTADQISDVSGRGVGMDVVRRNINDLGGHVSIASTPGKGSTLTISLPMTLAILDGQIVSVGGQTYIVSLVSIIESIQPRREHIEGIAGQAELYRLRDEYIPIVRLYDVFNIPPGVEDIEKGILVVVEAKGRRIALLVDELLGQQQVVIKSLEQNFRQIRGIAGATILGDGTVAMILDVAGVVDAHAADTGSGTPSSAAA